MLISGQFGIFWSPMKKRKTSNNYITKSEFKRGVKELSKRDDALSRSVVNLERNMNDRFNQVDRRFIEIDIKFMSKFDEMGRRFDRLESHIDSFLKRTENNEHEILFFGRQHDDLAKFCTEKIGYPVYGRNL